MKKKEKQISIESFFAKQTEQNKRTLEPNGSPPTSKKNKTSSSSDAPILIQDDDDDDPLSCPVCAKELKQEDAQRHINLCLDQTSPPPLNRNTDLALSPPENTPAAHHQQDIRQEKEDEEGSLVSEPSKPPTYTSKPRPVKTNKKGESGTAKRGVPFYKLMPGTTLSVDCFSHGAVPGVTGYFLSHAHSDHYTKLSSSWAYGKIYCSKTTANLVSLKLRVHSRWLVPLDFDRPYTIDGVRVVLIDANHCPGSAMFLFEGLTKPEGKPFRYLHCGDFRAMPSHLRHPEIHEKVIDICYLDTTYLDPKYCFPAQHQVIDGCCKAMKARVLEADRTATMSAKDQKKFAEMGRSRDVLKSWLTPSSPAVSLPPAAPSTDQPKVASSKDLDLSQAASGPVEVPTPNQPKLASIFAPKRTGTRGELRAKTTLIVVGTYSIGKERIVMELASALSTKVFCADARKVAVLKCIDEADEEAALQGMLTSNPLAAQIHLVNLFALNKRGFLESYLAKYRAHFSHVIGIKPTGWCYKPVSSPSTIASDPLAQDLAAYIAAFQLQQLDGLANPVGQLIFPEKVQPSIAGFVEIYGVPYSEHSSFFELCCFCLSFDWKRIVPTVNGGNARSRAQMQRWIDRWKWERVRLLKLPSGSSSSTPAAAADAILARPHDPASPATATATAAASALPPLLIPPRSHLFW